MRGTVDLQVSGLALHNNLDSDEFQTTGNLFIFYGGNRVESRSTTGWRPTSEGSHGQQQHYDGSVSNQVERSNAEQQGFEKA